MATNMELYVPSSPSKFSFRPLNKGMITSETTMSMPDGSFLKVAGFDVTTRGPKKNAGWKPWLYQTGTLTPLQFTSTDPTERIESQCQLTLSSGDTIEMFVTNRGLYTVDETAGFQRLNWSRLYTIATVSVESGRTTVTVTGDFRGDYITTTDKFVFGGVDYTINSTTATAGTLTIVFVGTPTIITGNTFSVYKPFAVSETQFVDFTMSRNTLYFVDGVTQMIWKFNGAQDSAMNYVLQPHVITGTDGTLRTIMGATTVTAFGDRLYFGRIIEQDGVSTISKHPNRIRWTEVLDHTKSPAANYQDLIRTPGKVTKLLGMGSLLMAYTMDAIYYGRATSLTSIPYAFTYIETAGVTASGMKAVSTYFDGQLFQGSDNVYHISSDLQITPIGTQISEDLRARSSTGYMSQIVVDTDRSRILVCTSNGASNLETMFMFNYKSQAWSIQDSFEFVAPINQLSSDCLSYYEVSDSDTYETVSYGDLEFRALSVGSTMRDLFCVVNGYFMRYREDLGLNHMVSGGIVQELENPCEIETPDFDFDDPDVDKTALRLSLKISEDKNITRTNPIYFIVTGSYDRGRTWKSLGRMRILPNRDEDALNFRLSGSTLRFRLRQGFESEGTSTDVAPFTISEVVLRLRERSIEAQRSNAREA